MIEDGQRAATVRAREQLIRELETRWRIEVGPPITLAPNYVVPARREDGSAVILKIGRPSDREIKAEIDALRIYGGDGIAALLEEDRDAGALLLERLEPGHSLRTVADDGEATRILASIMQRLWK